MLEIVNKKTGETIILPTPDHSKPAPKIDTLPKEEMDLCVSCGCETPYPKHMHIDYRFYYVEGAGQLCKECYEKIYK